MDNIHAGLQNLSKMSYVYIDTYEIWIQDGVITNTPEYICTD